MAQSDDAAKTDDLQRLAEAEQPGVALLVAALLVGLLRGVGGAPEPEGGVARVALFAPLCARP